MGLLTIREAAVILHRDPSTVRDLCRRGLLPARKVSFVWVIEEADVKTFAERERPPGRPRP